MNKGKIVQIIGPVVDVEFPEAAPAIYNALTAEYDVPGRGKTKQTLEVQQHLGDNWVRAVAMSTTEGSSAATKSWTPARRFPCPSAKPSWAACSTSPATPWTNKAR